MADRASRRSPKLVQSDGKPTAVIWDIDEYQEMLERLEDIVDLRMLEEIRKRPLAFRELDSFLHCCEAHR